MFVLQGVHICREWNQTAKRTQVCLIIWVTADVILHNGVISLCQSLV
jgi:hypothetical protein